jgi:hypothetical protein
MEEVRKMKETRSVEKNMNRRHYVQGLSSAVLIGTAGCVSEIKEQIPGQTNESETHTIGDSVQHRGVKVTPTQYRTSVEYTKEFEGGGSPSESAPTGATNLFFHLSVEHVGDSQRVFPTRGFGGSDIELEYDDEVLQSGVVSGPPHQYIVNDDQLTSYYHAVMETGANSEVYPGVSVSGWLLNIIAENFDPSKVNLNITWGSSSHTEDENSKTFTWTLEE